MQPPPEKSYPLSKLRSCQAPSALFENLVEGSIPHQEGGCTLCLYSLDICFDCSLHIWDALVESVKAIIVQLYYIAVILATVKCIKVIINKFIFKPNGHFSVLIGLLPHLLNVLLKIVKHIFHEKRLQFHLYRHDLLAVVIKVIFVKISKSYKAINAADRFIIEVLGHAICFKFTISFTN